MPISLFQVDFLTLPQGVGTPSYFPCLLFKPNCQQSPNFHSGSESAEMMRFTPPNLPLNFPTFPSTIHFLHACNLPPHLSQGHSGSVAVLEMGDKTHQSQDFPLFSSFSAQFIIRDLCQPCAARAGKALLLLLLRINSIQVKLSGL